MPPNIAPSPSPAILVPENFLPQLCRNSGIVTHSPPPNYFGPGLPTQSSSPSYLTQHRFFEHTLSQALGNPLRWSPQLFPVVLLEAGAKAECCHRRELVTGGHNWTLPASGRGQGP